jgi:sulfur relay (sulfurtransferase) complex TusBCD TusD component (DsrE family)
MRRVNCSCDSPVLDQLRAFQSHGVELILCQTCLDYYSLTERVAVGIVGGMPDIIESMQMADKVVSV